MISVQPWQQTHPGTNDTSVDSFLKKVECLYPVAKGSLTRTRSFCTCKGCKECASGCKHPKLILTFREEGKLRGMYVRLSQEKRVRRAIANGRELERLMTEAGRELVFALRRESGA